MYSKAKHTDMYITVIDDLLENSAVLHISRVKSSSAKVMLLGI